MSEFTQEQRDRMEQAFHLLADAASGKKQFQIGLKNDPSGSPSGPYATGQGGLFSTPGQEPTVFSSVMHPIQGVMNALPVMPQGSAAPDDPAYGGYDAPMFTTVTGVTAGNGDSFANQPAGPCDDAPVGGLLKACTLTASFGRYSIATRQLDIGHVAHLINRGETTNLRLVNNVLTREPFQTPSMFPTGGSDVLMREWQQRLMEAGISLQRLMAGQTWDGSPANNNAGGGAKQFLGLNSIIAAGNKVDAITGIACPSMDSDIKDFGYTVVNAASAPRDIVQYADMLYYFLETNAIDMGLDPVEWRWAMRPQLFDELVKVWPVRYYQEALLQINNFTNGRVVVAANESADFRDDMRNGQFLPIRGRRIPVLLDNSITEKNSTTNAQLTPGQYASDIYLIPFTVLGGIPVAWWEFFRQNNLQALQIEGWAANQTGTTDGGMFRWFVNHRNGCITWQFRVEPRIILRTPFLAGRIQNVAYAPLQHTRDWKPDQTYFVNGGRSAVNATRLYTEYSPSQPVVVG